MSGEDSGSYADVSRCLLSYGADVLQANEKGETPLDRCGGTEVEQLIREIAASKGYYLFPFSVVIFMIFLTVFSKLMVDSIKSSLLGSEAFIVHLIFFWKAAFKTSVITILETNLL